MSGESPTVNDTELQEFLDVVAAFHARRLNEMAIFEMTLNDVLPLNEQGARKDELSHLRLLRQPISYQVLALIWQASPFSAGRENWTGWETDDTVYSLSKRLMSPVGDGSSTTQDRQTAKRERERLANYITRVVEAGEFFALIQRETGDGNKRLLRGTDFLNHLMCEFARYALNDEYFRSRYNG